jgi:hypothetical protein
VNEEPPSPAQKAWATRRSATYRARRTARASQLALEQWAAQHGWRTVFLDAPSGHPRTGIVDAVLVRVRPRARDQIDVRLVQLKSGVAGLTAAEFDRLCAAAENVEVEGLAVLCAGAAVYATAVSRSAALGVALPARLQPAQPKARPKRRAPDDGRR